MKKKKELCLECKKELNSTEPMFGNSEVTGWYCEKCAMSKLDQTLKTTLEECFEAWKKADEVHCNEI